MKIFKQETKNSCGVACLRSILNNYGENLSEKDIWDKIDSFPLQKGGLRNPILSLGVVALKLGFSVTYLGYNPTLINNNSSNDLKKSLKEKSESYFDIGKFYVDQAIKFLDLGGKITFDKLNIEKIKKLIDKNKFLLVEIKPAFVNKTSVVSMHHKVILTGYDKKGFKILNPSDAKEHTWDYDTFLLSFYAAIPELLIIKKK